MELKNQVKAFKLMNKTYNVVEKMKLVFNK